MADRFNVWCMDIDTPRPGLAAPGSERRSGRLVVFLAAFLPLLAVYVATARTDLPYHIDAATNVFTAWTIGTTGSPILHDYAELAEPEHKGVFAWVVPSERGPVSQYPPGTALLAAPVYAIWSDATPVSLSAENAPADTRVTVPIPSLWPAAIVAALTTAAALGFVALTVLEASGSRLMAVTTALIGGFGTSAWTVAGHQLWQHGPNMLWVALGVYLAARNRWGWAGAAFGALAVTRAPVLLVGVTLGVMLIVRRDFRLATRLLAGSVPGVVALLVYNWWLFGRLSVAGGYGEHFARQAIEPDLGSYLGNIGTAFLDPNHGVFVWSPLVALVLVTTTTIVQRLPRWALASALGGLAYLLVQLKLNRSSGGSGFSYYRYPLESLAAAAPLLGAAGRQLWGLGLLPRIGFITTAGFSIVAHGIVAF